MSKDTPGYQVLCSKSAQLEFQGHDRQVVPAEEGPLLFGDPSS